MENFKKSFAAFIILALAGCTVEPKDGGVDAQFHTPLTYKSWQTRLYTTSNGIPVCAVSSGYNGLTVTLGEMRDGIDAVVGSNRIMQPGATLTVTVGGRNFEAYDGYFRPEPGRDLVKAMAEGDKAYLEWSEFSGPIGRERTHFQNIVRLDDFRARLKECRDALKTR